MTFKNLVADLLIGAAIGLVVGMVVLIVTGCTPTHYDYSYQDEPTIGSRPATSIECAMGGVVVLINGSPSPSSVICNGAAGTPGTPGHDGVDLTPISFVQFCQGVQPSYPDSFAEIGICVNHNLYGVYSANGGFMVLLPPGAYSSNGINASCGFTVTADCGVQ